MAVGPCGNCEFFRPQTTALTPGQKEILDEIPGGSEATYGKCRATFRDRDGIVRIHDFGTFSNLPCTAEDDQGDALFSPLVR